MNEQTLMILIGGVLLTWLTQRAKAVGVNPQVFIFLVSLCGAGLYHATLALYGQEAWNTLYTHVTAVMGTAWIIYEAIGKHVFPKSKTNK